MGSRKSMAGADVTFFMTVEERQAGREERAGAPSRIAVAAVAAAFGVLAGHLATPENRVWPSPWHHDDFNNLGHTGSAIAWGTVRPVSFAAWSLLGHLGPDGLYVALFALVAAHVALSVAWTAEVLGAPRRLPAIAAVAFTTGAALLLFEWAPWMLRYTGHTTNALSAAFGMGAALLALRIDRLGGRGPGRVAAMLLLYALSAGAKEDFVLLPLVSLGFAIARAPDGARRQAIVRAIAIAAAMAAIAAAALGYALAVRSPFVLGTGTYEAKLDLASLAATAGWYAVCTRYARNLLVGLAIATVASLALRLARPRAWCAVWLGLVALVAPYLPLGAHLYALYAFNWAPLMLAALFWTVAQAVTASRTSPARVAAVACGIAAVVSLYGIARKERRVQAAFIADAESWTSAAIDRAAALLAARPDARVVAVTGTDAVAHGPWFASSGIFLDRVLGREVRWIVLQRPGSFARQVLDQYGWRFDWGRIVYVDDACRPVLRAHGIPLLAVGADAPPAADVDAAAPPGGSLGGGGAATGGDPHGAPSPGSAQCGLVGEAGP